MAKDKGTCERIELSFLELTLFNWHLNDFFSEVRIRPSILLRIQRCYRCDVAFSTKSILGEICLVATLTVSMQLIVEA